MMIKLTQGIQFVAIALLLEATTPFTNSFNPSLSVQAQSQPTTEFTQERSHPMLPPSLDFTSAAKKLGITEAQLVEALGLPPKPPESDRERARPPRPDFAAAAQKLGTTESKLVEALGLPPKPPEFNSVNHPQGCMPPPSLDFVGAAKKLNVSKADLLKALNLIE